MVLVQQVTIRKGFRPGRRRRQGQRAPVPSAGSSPASVGLLPPLGPALPSSPENILLTFLTCVPSPQQGVSGCVTPGQGKGMAAEKDASVAVDWAGRSGTARTQEPPRVAAAWVLGDFAARPPGRAGEQHGLLRVQTALGLPSCTAGPQEESVPGQAGLRWGGWGAGSSREQSSSAADWKLQMSVLQPELALCPSIPCPCQSDRSSCPPGPESSLGCPKATRMGHLKSAGRGRT